MVNQTLISFKVDNSQLAELDRIASKLGVKCNKLLNFFVYYGNSMLADAEKLKIVSAYQFALSAFYSSDK